MSDWETTATTVYCEAIDDEVTLLFSRDGQVTCTGQQRYQNPDDANARRLAEKSGVAGRKLACTGTGCDLVAKYVTEFLRESTPD